MITVDDREVTEHPEIPILLKTPSQVHRLDAGDYGFLDANSEPLGIERCEIGNYVQKLRSGELEAQMYKCQSNYNTTILLIEGVYDHVAGLLSTHKNGNKGYFRIYVYPHVRYDATMASLVRLSQMGIEVVYSPTFECSMMIVDIIYDQRTKPEESHTMFKKTRSLVMPAKLTTNKAVPMLMALCPRLPEKVAIRLIHKYDTIWEIINADDKELVQVEGFGKGLVKRLKESVGKA